MKEIVRELEPNKQVHKIAGRNFDHWSVSDDDPKGVAQEA